MGCSELVRSHPQPVSQKQTNKLRPPDGDADGPGRLGALFGRGARPEFSLLQTPLSRPGCASPCSLSCLSWLRVTGRSQPAGHPSRAPPRSCCSLHLHEPWLPGEAPSRSRWVAGLGTVLQSGPGAVPELAPSLTKHPPGKGGAGVPEGHRGLAWMGSVRGGRSSCRDAAPAPRVAQGGPSSRREQESRPVPPALQTVTTPLRLPPAGSCSDRCAGRPSSRPYTNLGCQVC